MLSSLKEVYLECVVAFTSSVRFVVALMWQVRRPKEFHLLKDCVDVTTPSHQGPQLTSLVGGQRESQWDGLHNVESIEDTALSQEAGQQRNIVFYLET